MNNDILYLNTLELKNEDINKLVFDYASPALRKIKNIFVPNLIYFQNGEAIDILYTKKNVINKNDMIDFLERNDVLSND